MYGISLQLKLVALAAVGEMVYNEGNKAVTICYNIINNLEINNQAGFETLTSKLTSFIQQVGYRNPRVTASSCFVVRFSMIGFVVASVTSYIIVAVQFMVQEKR
nr:unnamed protein product [Callosobruchus analis]